MWQINTIYGKISESSTKLRRYRVYVTTEKDMVQKKELKNKH